MYWEAIRALDDSTNTERYAIAGHLLREVQDRLPAHLAVPQASPGMRLGDVFTWLINRWNTVTQRSGCRGADGAWAGDVDAPLSRFLGDLGNKISQYEADRPRRADIHQRTLTYLDPALGAVPAVARVDIVQVWMSLHDVFTSAAHHGTIGAVRFEGAVEGFEALLGDRIVPRTFERQDQIAQLVREAEGRADA